MVSASLGYMSKRFLFLMVSLAGIAFSQAKLPAAFLPQQFNGWRAETQSMKTGADPAAVDPADFVVLKEYGFANSEAATYSRDGRKIQVKAARFNDASGAFGAFTYYLQPQMRTEKIGDQGASNNNRILFYKGNILVDVSLDRVTAMSGADLRMLGESLPRTQGNTAALPVLPGNLPSQSRIANSIRYIVGPEALARLGVPIPAQMIDFSKSPEVAMAKYRTSAGEATLTIIGYPTPQIAREKLAALQSAPPPGGPFQFKRSGPFLAAVNGNIPADEAQSLLASINYDADVTWNQPTKLKPGEDRAGFVVALVLLCIIAVLAALVFGFAFGGIRILLNRLFPNRVFNRSESADIIRLDLK
ncbi:MAG TPA: DUF6599 family protein [Candidatus Sulfotelmatobacter sp.]|nr:DUF6599 family protein [Candidatus Sulfotelmatobacter sp.]